ncbi:MAG: inositol monophosphatase [Proteobacteria bacterium]|nr:inositol monophosphatase [Pseudomonadota bacterium]
MAVRSAIINVMAKAALKAARGLVRDFGEVEQLQVSVKGPGDFVSTADHKAEEVLIRELTHARPRFGLLTEERGEVRGADGETRFLVDPLDGTTNFLHGIPHFAISIALEHRRDLTAGVIYDPLRDELFWAEKGAGAYVNDRRLRVSARRRLAEAVIATGIPFADMPHIEPYLKTLAAVMPATAGVRRLGSASLDLAYIAAGRYDGFWEFGLHPWDIAAGVVLVREAGGYVSELGPDGRIGRGGAAPMESGNLFAANDHLHDPLASLLSAALAG